MVSASTLQHPQPPEAWARLPFSEAASCKDSDTMLFAVNLMLSDLEVSFRRL